MVGVRFKFYTALPISPQCHCELFKVSDMMKAKCKDAHDKCKNAQGAASNIRKEATAEMVERKDKSDKDEKERMDQLKDDMKVRKVFRPSRHSEPIYEKTDKKGKAGDKKKVVKPNNDSKNKTTPDKTQPSISTKTPLSRAKAKLFGTNSLSPASVSRFH